MVLMVTFLETSNMAGVVNVVKYMITNYKKQIKTIDKLADKKANKDKKVLQTYEETAKQIQEKRDIDLEKVNAKKIQLVEDLKDESADQLAKKMKEEFKL